MSSAHSMFAVSMAIFLFFLHDNTVLCDKTYIKSWIASIILQS